MTRIRKNKTVPTNLVIASFLVLFILVLVPSKADAASSLKAGRSDNINETGLNMPTAKMKVPDTSFREMKLVMPESGVLFLKCNEIFSDDDNYNFVWLSYNEFGDDWVYPEQSFPICKDNRLGIGYLKKGTYYIQVSNIEPDAYTYEFTAWYYRTANMTLPAGVRKTGACYSETGKGKTLSQCFKISIPARGSIRVNVRVPEKKQTARICIYNSSKRLFKYGTKEVPAKKDKFAYMAVEPGTYYLKVGNLHGPFMIRYTFQKTKDTDSTLKRSTAPSLGKNSDYFSTCYTKDSVKKWSRYYKIDVFRYGTIYVSFSNDAYVCQIHLLNAKGSVVPVVRKKGYFYSKREVDKGTYYIRVTCSFDNDYRKRSMGEVQKIDWDIWN